MADTERFLNLGAKVNTSIGEVTVKEPSLKVLVTLTQDLPALFTFFKESRNGEDTGEELQGISWVTSLMMEPKVQGPVFDIIAAFCAIDRVEAEKLTASDIVYLIAKAKEVVNWEDLVETFFTILPMNLKEMLTSIGQTTDEVPTEPEPA